MAGRAARRDENGRKLPWRPPGAAPVTAADHPHAQAKAIQRQKPDGAPSPQGWEVSAENRRLRKLAETAFPVSKGLPPRPPNPRLLTDAQLIALVKQLERVDKYDWSTNARPEQIEPAEYNVWILNAGRGFGKMLELGVEIPTPTGWTKLGELRVGDNVFDELGQPCRVTWLSNVETPEKTYRITFSDGTTINACSEHQWVTWTHSNRKAFGRTGHAGLRVANEEFPKGWAARSPITTQGILDTLTYGTRSDRNHCIPTCGALDLPAADLPIDPYLLGAWLGDGHSAGATFTCSVEDRPHLEAAARRAGYEIGKTRPSDRITFGVIGGLYVDLTEAGLVGRKHVPDAYLRSSIDQRLAILRGLMDTDGSCGRDNGYAEFTSTNARLAHAVRELAISLGEKVVMGEGRATINGKDCGPKWRVTWRPTVNPFSLPRKVALVHPPGMQGLRSRHRMIVSVEPIAPVPMRCITVDSPNSMYLVGRSMVPTHNTRTGAETVRDWTENQGLKRIAVIAKASRELRDICFEGVSGLNNVYPKDAIGAYYKGLGDTRIDLANGAKIIGFTAESPDSIRGHSFDAIWGDEFAAWPKHLAQDMYDQAWFCMRESTDPRMILTTTPKRVQHLMDLLERAKIDPKVVVTAGKTTDNTKLSKAALAELYARYAGTHLGRQELGGELLMDVEGALWVPPMLEASRWPDGQELPKFRKVIIGVDPSGSATGDATGIVAIGYTNDKRIFVLGCYSTKGLPAHRYGAVVKAAVKHRAPGAPLEILVEYNHGGDNTIFAISNQWKHMLQSDEIDAGEKCPLIKKSTLKGDKAVKAGPVAALYEQQMNLNISRIWHLPASKANGLDGLENEQLSWAVTDKQSPNSLDALTIAARRAMLELGLEATLGTPGAGRQIRDGYRPW